MKYSRIALTLQDKRTQRQARYYISAAWLGIGVFAAVSIPAAALPDTLGVLNAVVSLVLFGIGCIGFIWAFFISAARSRTEQLHIAGIYFLSKSAPPYLAWYFRFQLIIICVIAFTTAGIRPFTALAFGILTPVYIMGVMGLWGAKWGSFDKLSR